MLGFLLVTELRAESTLVGLFRVEWVELSLVCPWDWQDIDSHLLSHGVFSSHRSGDQTQHEARWALINSVAKKNSVSQKKKKIKQLPNSRFHFVLRIVTWFL